MTGQLLSPGAPRHRCEPPGWWERRRLGVRDDARWKCECSRVYQWSSSGNWDGGWSWSREQ